MKRAFTILGSVLLTPVLIAQTGSKSVTVPITLDHNRIVIDVFLPMPDGTSKRVRAWVDSGNPDLVMSRRVAALEGAVSCEGPVCKATPPRDIVIGGMKIPLGLSTALAPAQDPADVMIAGMSPEMNLPTQVLRNYDIVLDYANRELTVGEPGSVPFPGKASKAEISTTGQIEVVSQIAGQTYNLALDTGASISGLSSELISRWHKVHASWPFLTGAVGAANRYGTPDEVEVQVLRVPSLRFGNVDLASVAFATLGPQAFPLLAKQAEGETMIGRLGGNAFRNYRVGIDYAHGTVYLDRLTAVAPPDMDVVGLTLRPERDGRYLVVAVVNYAGKPSVAGVGPGDVLVGVDGAPATGATMGQVWSLLGGRAGQTRALTLERGGQRFTVAATVRRFLASQSPPDRSTLGK